MNENVLLYILVISNLNNASDGGDDDGGDDLKLCGVVRSLDEALNFFLNKTLNRPKNLVSDKELITRWEVEEYFVQVWCGIKKIDTYKFNKLTKILDKM